MNLAKICSKIIRIPLSRYYSPSALYITGDKASTTFSVLTPHLDLEERLMDREALELNLKYRGYITQVSNLEEVYNFYKTIEQHLTIAEITRSEINKRIDELLKSPEKDEDAISKLKTPAHIAKKEYKEMKTQFQGIEEMTALKILDLPNVLHSKTPIQEDDITYTYLEQPKGESKSHMDLAVEKNLVEYINPQLVFLSNEAALFELSMTNCFSKRFREMNYTQFSNTDFARSIIVEGCGMPYESKFCTFTLDYGHSEIKNPVVRDHLVGGASLYSFMVYFARHSIQQAYIPLRLFAVGRTYQPTDSDEKSLFNVTQSTGLQCFIATHDTDIQENVEFDSVVELVKQIYESFGVHFRMVIRKCNQLEQSESLRLSIQMYSPNKCTYIEVGNVSLYERFLSKRLLFTYNENHQRKFLRVISGTVLNVQKLLGCLIENNAVRNDDLIPEKFTVI